MTRVTASLFFKEFEAEAIERIKKFSKIAELMGFDVALGFSGGKDSQVIYDLAIRSGIEFKAYFNHSFESSVTRMFIRKYYPDVIVRRDHNFGFIENIYKNHGGLLPTVEMAYCCSDYKHNQKYVDECSIVGVRRQEGFKRKKRTVVELKNKTILKKNKNLINDYFEERCQSIGVKSVIQLKPIVDWHEEDVWSYIKKYNLPINPDYEKFSRVGCIVCPKANFTRNSISLLENPGLVNAFIRARERGHLAIDWIITTDNVDYQNDKVYYICRWLNHSFRSFTKKQQKLYEKVREIYDKKFIKQ